MYCCLRVDLDYVPWDTPDAQDFGHGEPAIVLKMLELARTTGYKFHFFASHRVLRALPAIAEAVLNDGHDLDWYCKHPERLEEMWLLAEPLFRELRHQPLGVALKAAWMAEYDDADLPGTLAFVSTFGGVAPRDLRFFPVETRPAREAYRLGMSARSWTDATKGILRDGASRNRGVTVAVRPQVLARFDPKLAFLREILDLTSAIGLPIVTLRDLLAKPG